MPRFIACVCYGTFIIYTIQQLHLYTRPKQILSNDDITENERVSVQSRPRILLPKRERRLLREFEPEPEATAAGIGALGGDITLMNDAEPDGESGDWISVGVLSPEDTPLSPCFAKC
jgi:hypothetical protein